MPRFGFALRSSPAEPAAAALRVRAGCPGASRFERPHGELPAPPCPRPSAPPCARGTPRARARGCSAGAPRPCARRRRASPSRASGCPRRASSRFSSRRFLCVPRQSFHSSPEKHLEMRRGDPLEELRRILDETIRVADERAVVDHVSVRHQAAVDVIGQAADRAVVLDHVRESPWVACPQSPASLGGGSLRGAGRSRGPARCPACSAP